LKTLVKISIFIVFLYNWAPGIAQTQISGIINRYAAVISSNGTDNVTVDNATGFATGDTVLIIQMRGATFEPLLNNALSNIQYTGRYEFIAVQQVNGNQIKFRSNLINTYDPSQAIQIVRVPYYQSAKVTGTLTCTPWDSTSNSSKGGVLALIVGDTLELTADIDVSNNGFLGGGKTANGNTICYQYTNQLNYSKYAIDSAGLKGSGIVQVGYAYTRGLGELGNAGGGGNGFGSGGGGGAGYGVGGNGGQASSICPDQNPLNLDLGGYGGQAPKDYFAGITNEQRDRIFMGGGGGAGRGQYLSDGTNGANGGGIVFIIARNLKTNNYYLRSNGGNVTTNAVNQAGAGGGGGGGSILISLDNVIGLLNLEAKGGKGGNSNYCNGLGGGGGGGFVWYTGPTLPLGTLTLSAGDPGITSMSPCTNIKPGFSGGSGDSANHLNPVLNGFLFNLIGISQTICNGEIPQKLTGTHPRGGNGVYTYQWQSRNRTSGYNWIDITGATNLEYSSPALYDTTDFRRIVNSVNINTGVPITDTSKWIKIKVRPEIKGLSIAPADTAICFNLPQVPIRGATAYGGDSSYSLVYLWEESLDNSTWVTASIPPTNGKDYTGTSNQTSKYYRRKVINNACTVVSNNSYITVYPSISGNQLQPDSVICNGSVPNSMRGVKTLSGGAGTGSYRYQWLKNSSDSLHWIQISASDTFQSYTPGALNNTIFYRRVVFSGLRNTCKDSSYRVKVNVLPSIANNFIHQDQTTICQNTRPNRFLGDQPTGGTNTYLYQWESSADNSAWTPLQQPKIDSVNYTNGIINIVAPAYFRRTIFSGAYNCCKNSSASIKIIVQPKIENNTIVDTAEICYGQTSPGLNQTSGLSLTGGDNTTYTYQWFRRPVDSTIWKDCFTAAPSYLPGALFKTNYYKRKVISGTCVSFSDSIKINVLPLISGNTKPGGRHEVCENAIPEAFIGPRETRIIPLFLGIQYFWQYLGQHSRSK